ncbi:hypothetical protein KY366_00845 [Candidatus Woesearchaeota archaeon]|nr:hypothetical protein [Candidatus Woesearchaeota archaeon]
MKLTYDPGLSNLVYDSDSGKYMQYLSGPGGYADFPPEMTFMCRDLLTGGMVEYKISEFDVIKVDSKEVAKKILPINLQQNFYKIDRGFCLTGNIVKRR